jgi:hypothetical protein
MRDTTTITHVEGFCSKNAQASRSFTSPGRAVVRGAVSRDRRELKALRDLGLDEEGCALVALVAVLFVDCRVVLLRALAALQHG